MQKDLPRRGFSISHQRVVLEIDFSGSIRGYTDLTIVPTTGELKTIYLHCRQCVIESVIVASHKADYYHHDPLAGITLSNNKDCHIYPELKRKLFSALTECDEGELAIGIPGQVSLKQADITVKNAPSVDIANSNTTMPATPDFAPLNVRVEYYLKNPVDGLQFVFPTEAYPNRVPHVYTTPTSPDAARCWVPCLDNAWEKCTWDFEFVVPRTLEEGDQERARKRAAGVLVGEEEPQEDECPTLVVCSGDLVERIAHPFNSNKTIFLFNLSALTSVQHIAFAAGPFHLISLPIGTRQGDSSETASQPPMHVFCLPGLESALSCSATFLRGAMTFYTDMGQYPYSSFKVVFVDEMVVQHFDAATISLATVDLLHDWDAIDQVFETRQVLAHALACQWSGVYIQPKTFSDTWLINGIALYMSGLFLKKHLGVNDYRFRLKKDIERVLQRDVGTMPPVCQPGLTEPPDPANINFINMKSALILHILDRKLGKSGTSLGLSRAFPKIFLSAISGDMHGNALSTHSFLRTCRKVSGVDLRSFADQWIYGSGCPRFGFSATFNRKRMAVEITMRQEAPAFAHNEHDPVALALLKPVPFFDGQMTIRIHEADGTPYEHVLDIRTNFKRYEVPFNTKYKRVRRNTKRFLARQAAAAAAAQGDAEAAEAIGMIDMGFGLEVWENVKERENWKVADWTEEDEQIMSGAVYEWIRLDADFEWISSITFEQPDYMWVSQLQRDRDVVAQLEAVNALARQPSLIVSSTLTKTALVSNYFFRIRVEAVLALITCAIRKLDFIGLFHLFKMFMRYCYKSEDTTQELFTCKYVPRPNDFSDIADYFVRKAIITAVSLVRLENGKSPPIVRQFLIDQLRYNDNTNNPYADALYICNIVSALAAATVSILPPERGQLTISQSKADPNAEDKDLLNAAVAEVARYRNMDRLVPSWHNVVTVAALEFHLILILANLVPNDSKPFLACSREGNYSQVRVAAFDGLLLSKWYAPKMMNYLLLVIMNDSSSLIRRHLARNVCESLAILYAVGEIKSISREESLLIEEDGAVPEQSYERRKNDPENMLKSLRKDKEIGKNDVLRETIMPLLTAPDVDFEVRWTILKLAEMTLRGAEETLPKVVIHLPPTPVTEQPPPIPPTLPNTKNAKLNKVSLRPGISPVAVVPPALNRIRLPSAVPRPASPAVAVNGTASRKSTSTPVDKKKAKPHTKPTGMTPNDTQACRKALKRLLEHKHSLLFLQPVDPVRDRAPNYFNIIKNPIDLSTMGAKLAASMYQDRSQFEDDFKLMINNAKQYNAAGSFAYNESLTLEAFFIKQWNRIKNTLERAELANRAKDDITDMDVDTAIATVLELDVPSPAVSAPQHEKPLPASNGGPKLKLKLGGLQKPKQSKASSSDSKSNKKQTPEPRQTATLLNNDGTTDDFFLQEVEALEKTRPRMTTLVKVDEKNGVVLNPPDRVPKPGPSKPTIKLKRTPQSEPKLSVLTHSTTQAQDLTIAESSSKTARESTPLNLKKCRDALKVMKRMPEAGIFLRPVDPELDGCPTYYDEIDHPMDLGTITEKLEKGKYESMESFAADVDLVFENCRQFNPPTTQPVQLADAVQAVWKKEWAKSSEKRLAGLDKRGLQGLLSKLLKDEYLVFFFKVPVDPVALGIPEYFKIIPKKDARDLKTIRSKLDSDRYDSTGSFEADIQLMVDNAIKFNGPDSEVGIRASALLRRVRELLATLQTVSAKRRKEDQDAPKPAKKLKVSST